MIGGAGNNDNNLSSQPLLHCHEYVARDELDTNKKQDHDRNLLSQHSCCADSAPILVLLDVRCKHSPSDQDSRIVP